MYLREVVLGGCYETSQHRACRVDGSASISCESGVDRKGRWEACFFMLGRLGLGLGAVYSFHAKAASMGRVFFLC